MVSEMMWLARLRRRGVALAGSLALVLAGTTALAGNASAASGSVDTTGTVSSGSGLMTNPSGCVPGGTTSGHYSATTFTLDGSVASTITISVVPSGFQGVATLYQGVFDPGNTVTDCFATVTGSGSGAPITLTSPAPEVGSFGQTYSVWVLVVSGASASDVGPYTATLSSSNTDINLGDGPPTSDTTPPVITVPANKTVAATSANGATVTYTATASDDVDGPVTPSCTPASGTTFPLGLTTVTCNAVDLAGNHATPKTFTITVADQTAPTITGRPASDRFVLQATGPSGATLTLATSGLGTHDDVDASPTLTCTPTLPQTFALGDHPDAFSCTATDAAGNASPGVQFSVLVQDTTGPVLTVPADITREATGADGATVTYPTSATDAVDGDVPVSCQPASGSAFALGPTTVSCSATDSHDNTSTKTFSILVQDTTAPRLTVPADISADATGPDGASLTYTASATDTVDGTLTPTCTPASGTIFPLGSTTVTCTAEDHAGNVGSASFHVLVTDASGPVLTLPAPITAEATGPDGATVSYSVTATDAVDGAAPVSCTTAAGPASPGDEFALGTTTVSCTAADLHGNSTAGTFTIIVADTTAPDVTVPAAITAEAVGPSGAPVTFTVSAGDLVDGTDPIACTATGDVPVVSGDVFPLGTTTVTCDATDAHDNTGQASFEVTVQDTTAPVLTLPDAPTAEATGPDGAPVSFTATATDLVDGSITPTCAPASATTFALGTTAVTCSATDAAGNTSSGTFEVTVTDTTGPVITTPGHLNVKATSAKGAVVDYHVTARDAVRGDVPVTCSPASGTLFPVGDTTVTCTASDMDGDPATAVHTLAAVRPLASAPAAGTTTTVSFTVTVGAYSPPGGNSSSSGGTGTQTSGSGTSGSQTSPSTTDGLAQTGMDTEQLLLVAMLLVVAGLVLSVPTGRSARARGRQARSDITAVSRADR